PILERGARRPAENRTRLGDVRLHAALLARPQRRVPDLVFAGRVAEGAGHVAGKLVDGTRPPAAEVEDAALGRGMGQDVRPGIDDILDVDEVAGLLAVAEDGYRLA